MTACVGACCYGCLNLVTHTKHAKLEWPVLHDCGYLLDVAVPSMSRAAPKFTMPCQPSIDMDIATNAVTGAQMMGDISFLVTLTNFPKEQINDETVELLRPYVAAPDFNYNAAKKVRSIATSVGMLIGKHPGQPARTTQASPAA